MQLIDDIKENVDAKKKSYEEKQEQKRLDEEERKILEQKEKYMKLAYKQAEKAYEIEEAPIGCVIITDDGKVIGKGYNRRNKEGSVLAHAEIIAIEEACKKVHDWRLEDCTMYVTLEPCPMCAGAIVQSRMKKVVIGAMNSKAGCAGSVINLLQYDGFNHKVEIEKGILGDECSAIMTDFFDELRDRKKRMEDDNVV